VFEDSVLRRIFELKRYEVTEHGENCVISILIIYNLGDIFLGYLMKKDNRGEGGGT
jgi:hypothetical protein